MRALYTPLGPTLAAALALVTVAAPHVARADDKDTAASLFTEAGRLVDAGDLAAACPKYEQSLRLFDGVNTRYFLADCYERTGKVASAWTLFLEVATKAVVAGDGAKEAKARERAAAIAARVPRLTIAPPEAPAATEGLEIARDGAPLSRAQWGAALPIDPGPHAIDATAPGKKPFHLDVTVASEGESAKVAIPPLEADPSAAAAPVAGTRDDGSVGDGRRVVGLALGGTGVAALVVGSVLGFAAKSRFDEAKGSCIGDLCDASGVEVRASAVRRANAATIVFGIGAAAVVGGGVLWLTAPRSARQVAVGVAPSGLVLRGAF